MLNRSGGLLHCIALCARIHHHQAIEAKFCGTGGHLTMQVKAAVSELQHCPQQGEASTGLDRQQLQCRHDRLRRSVVSLIQNRQPAQLEASVAASGHGHLHRLKLADAEPQVLGNRDRKQHLEKTRELVQFCLDKGVPVTRAGINAAFGCNFEGDMSIETLVETVGDT